MKPFCLLIVALLAVPAMAQGPDCRKASTQMDLDACAGQNFAAADRNLNALYAALMKKYQPQYQSLLKDAEKKWLAYRDAECAFEAAQTVGGSINAMEVTICRMAKTNARIKELQAQRDCAEGDMTCNAP